MTANTNTNAKAFRTVRERGREAARAGKSIDTCPYKETQQSGKAKVSFGNRWRAEWLKGFNSVKPAQRVEQMPP